MTEFRNDLNASINGALFIVKQLRGKVDFHRLFKILYFADRKHLATYGRPITGDRYVAMTKGPVPSELYDILTYNRGDNKLFTPPPSIVKLIEGLKVQDSYYVVTDAEPNMDFLSESAVEILEWSIREYGYKSFDALTLASHDKAYDKASENCDISYLDMAEVENISEGMRAYIAANIENTRALSSNARFGR